MALEALNLGGKHVWKHQLADLVSGESNAGEPRPNTKSKM